MLDNFIVNIRTILPIANANNKQDDKFSRSYANESAIAFLEQSSNRNYSNYSSGNNRTERTMLNAVRSYFSNLYRKESASNHDNDIMLPRSYKNNNTDLQIDWDPVGLKVREEFIEDIDNVVDKFVRVISFNDTYSHRRTELFYVIYMKILCFIH